MAAAHRVSAFRIDPELLAAMEQLRERVGISLSEQMRRALRAWLVEQGALMEKPERGRAANRKMSR